MTAKTSITVSIDLEDEHERKLFEYVMSKGSRKKSGYIKRLIHADMVKLDPVYPYEPRKKPDQEDEEVEIEEYDFGDFT